MIYLICFFVSTIFAVAAERSNKKTGFVVWSILSVFITSFLAGMRDLSVGIDTIHYYDTWSTASNLSLRGFFEWYYSNGSGEYLFALYTGIVSHVFKNFNVYLLLSSLIVVGAVYIGAFRLKKYIYPPLALLLFYLLYFNYTLNITRQYMAMAIQFAFLSDLLDKKYFKYLIVIIITAQIHTTSWIALFIMLSFIFLYGIKDDKGLEAPSAGKLRIKAFTIIAGIIIVTFGFDAIITFLISRNILSSKYLFYLKATDTINPRFANAFLLFEMAFLAMNIPGIKKQYKDSSFFIVSAVSFFLLYQLIRFISFGKRISQYYCFINIVTICMISRVQNNKNHNRIIISAGIVLAMLVYWIYFYWLKNASHTMPYISVFQI